MICITRIRLSVSYEYLQGIIHEECLLNTEPVPELGFKQSMKLPLIYPSVFSMQKNEKSNSVNFPLGK